MRYPPEDPEESALERRIWFWITTVVLIAGFFVGVFTHTMWWTTQ